MQRGIESSDLIEPGWSTVTLPWHSSCCPVSIQVVMNLIPSSCQQHIRIPGDRTANAGAHITCKISYTLVPRALGMCDRFWASSGLEIYCSYLSSACQLIPLSPMSLYSFEGLFWVCPSLGIQHVLEDPCGSTCLTSGWILIAHIKLLSKTFLLHIYFPAGTTGPCTWRRADPLPVTHHSNLKLNLHISHPKAGRVPFPQGILRKFQL